MMRGPASLVGCDEMQLSWMLQGVAAIFDAFDA